MQKTNRNEIMLTVIISGPSATIDKFIEDHSKIYRVEKIEVAPQIFKGREEHGLAEGDEPTGETAKEMSDLLWEKFNYGIHPASEKDGGYVGVINQKTTKFPIDIVDIVGSLSDHYPELFFDVTCDDPICNLTTITLLVAGEIVLFSDISNKWSSPKDKLWPA